MEKFDSLEIMPTRIKVASILRKSILSGELKAGEELSLTATANELGVSRTPIREAFQTLASENLIALRMNKGAIVLGITAKTIQEHFEMRKLLEGEAVARAISHGIDTDKLQLIHTAILNTNGDFSSDEYHLYNQKFHTSIWIASDNSKMYSILSSLWNGSSFGKTISEKKHQLISLGEHGHILEYIKKKDTVNARREMELHIERSMQNIMDSFKIN